MFLIRGGKELRGSVKIAWSKNAVLPILAAALLIWKKVTLKNVPVIGDVQTFLDIFSSLWIQYQLVGDTLTLDNTNLKKGNFDVAKMKKVRASVLLLAPILHHFGEVQIPMPGGCNIGKRPVDDHLEWLKKIGYEVAYEGDMIRLYGKVSEWAREMNAGFSVTATENIIVANVLRTWETVIKNIALEPHVINLIDFLRSAGADIKIRYDHSLVITWVVSLASDIEFEVVSDYIQSGTYMVIAALCAKDYIDIQNARIEDLYVFIEKLKEAGVKVEEKGNDTLRVHRATDIKPTSFQTNIYPGFPTDLQSPFTLLLTQANGMSKVHEVLFESRLNWLVELEKLGANIAILNPHQAMIFGPTRFKAGATLTSWDLRAGAAVVIAALLVSGETHITNIDYIKRGYDNFVENLQKLGADIEELES
jgi:UDP-N-acetylglucosamine 1-carboxyvinyltransferase